MGTLFLSFASQDAVLVSELREHLLGLVGLGYVDEVFLDRRSIRPGEDWSEALTEAARRADVFVLCMSPEYFKSDWCTRERELALRSGALILPVLWRACEYQGRSVARVQVILGARGQPIAEGSEVAWAAAQIREAIHALRPRWRARLAAVLAAVAAGLLLLGGWGWSAAYARRVLIGAERVGIGAGEVAERALGVVAGLPWLFVAPILAVDWIIRGCALIIALLGWAGWRRMPGVTWALWCGLLLHHCATNVRGPGEHHDLSERGFFSTSQAEVDSWLQGDAGGKLERRSGAAGLVLWLLVAAGLTAWHDRRAWAPVGLALWQVGRMYALAHDARYAPQVVVAHDCAPPRVREALQLGRAWWPADRDAPTSSVLVQACRWGGELPPCCLEDGGTRVAEACARVGALPPVAPGPEQVRRECVELSPATERHVVGAARPCEAPPCP